MIVQNDNNWKPCPFCGCSELFVNISSITGISGKLICVGCTNCKVVVKSNEELPENHRWNQRYEPIR